MRLLHCIWSMDGGGAERQLRDLAPALAARGHDVHVASVFGGVHLAALTPKCTVHEIRPRTSRDPRIVTRLFSLIRRLRPDLVQTWLTYTDIAAGVSATLLRVPWVLSERSSALMYPSMRLAGLRVVAGRRASLIIANSPGGAQYWRDHGVDRLEVIPNFVSLPAPGPDEPFAGAAIAGGDEVILAIGRLVPEKNLLTLVRAFAALQKKRPAVKLVFCGIGPQRDALEAEGAALGVSERLHFPGFVNVASWLKRASAVASVSTFEGHPNAVLEAMAARVPVVLSDIPSHHHVAGDDAAWFAPVTDAAAVARQLERVLTSPDEAAQKAGRARQLVENLSLEMVAARYEDAYRKVLDARRPAGRHMLIPKDSISR
ncbi:MAG TPA: glycosyltransferase [Thermoanaerobaculia bacterium]|nr:glycosyltransferase [Thermoanaerobaculia bacterium]